MNNRKDKRININTSIRRKTRCLPLLLTLGLVSCGGGGGGGSGDHTLYTTFGYPTPVAYLWQPVTFNIQSGGLDGNVPHCSISSGTLPPGLALNSNGCQVSGTPTTVGNYSVEVTLTLSGYSGAIYAYPNFIVAGPTNDYGNVAGAFPLNVGLPQTLSPQPLSGFTWHSQAGQSVTYSITSGSLPPGMSLNTSTGVISGQPTTFGPYQFAVGLTATNGSATYSPAPHTYSVNVENYPLQVGYSQNVTEFIGSSNFLQPNVVNPLRLSAKLSYALAPNSDPLPPGVSLDPSDGSIGGTPTGPIPGGNTSHVYHLVVLVTLTTSTYSTILPPISVPLTISK